MECDVLQEFVQDDVYKQFLTDDFDVKVVTSLAVKCVTVTENLAKLSSGISLLDKELHNQVANHYEDLLSQATEIETLEAVLLSVHKTINLLLVSTEKLHSKIVVPYEEATNQANMLMRLQMTCDLLRRIIRISQLCHRLETHLRSKAPEITKSAQYLNELDYLKEGVDLSEIDIIYDDLQFVMKAREQVDAQAKKLLQKGLEAQNSNDVSTALQVFYYLQILVPTVQQIVHQTKDKVCKSILKVLDVRSLSQLPQDSSHKVPGRAAIPMTGNASTFRANLWTNVEQLTSEIYSACSQVQHLEKVLLTKRDPSGHIYFKDVLALDEKNIIQKLWQYITDMLTKNFCDAANESTFIKQAFEAEYPKLLHLFIDLIKKLQQFNHSFPADDTVINGNDLKMCNFFSSNGTPSSPEFALRNALVPFENAYLNRCLSRLMDSVNVVYSGEMYDAPTTEDIEGILNVINSELRAASIDSILLERVARNVADAIFFVVEKSQFMVSADSDAVQVIDVANNKQLLNAKLVHSLHLILTKAASGLRNSNAFEKVKTIIENSLKPVESLIAIAVEPILNSMESCIEDIIITIHKEDFSISTTSKNENDANAQCSLFMKELQSFIARSQTDYLSLFPDNKLVLKGIELLANRTIELFVRHASLVRPLGDGGKMRLAADFAQMEMAIVPFCSRIGDLGKSYRLLRSFRPLLFQTPNHIAQSPSIGDVIPYSTALHFLFSKAPQELQSPYQVAGWSIREYSQWLDEHSEEEKLTLIKGTLEAYVVKVKKNQDKEFCSVYPVMIDLLHKGMKAL